MAEILIIDDDELLTAVVALKFARAGHTVRTARNGSEGLALALERRPDAVLLDVMMPVMTGPETLGRIRMEPTLEGVPVIILSARESQADIRIALAEGAADYVVKPFVAADLLARVEAFIAAPGRADAA